MTMTRVSTLSIGVLVVVLGAQVLCSPETQMSGREGASETSAEDAPRVMHKRAPSYDFGLGKKRAYTYVSEYKRLPVYNFGLGKRSVAYEDAEDDNQWTDDDAYDEEDDDQHPYDAVLKRARPYSFGLGKRIPDNIDDSKRFSKDSYGFGLGKKAAYEFGLGKRSPYEFGLGKRSPYEFGLGKRSPYDFGLGQRMQYDFGLGRRSPYEFGLGKRSPYEFGLGKRSPYEFGLGKRMPYEFGLGKRSPYEFGLGKKSELMPNHIPAKYKQVNFDVSRRQGDNRFGFGLGKRNIPDEELNLIFGDSNKTSDAEA